MISYTIKLKGHLDERWEILFEGFTIRHGYTTARQPVTELHGAIGDQSELYGFISRLRDINATLISINSDHDSKE